ncbi:MAG: hypothetical protein V3V13_10015 [Paracoccaceae bacterium]
MSKFLFIIIGIVSILAFLETFTAFNILSPRFLLNAEYTTYPLLKEDVKSDSHEIVLVDKSNKAHITYSPGGHFFLIDGWGEYIKIDEQGNIVSRIEQTQERSRIVNSPYLVSSTGIIDMAKPHAVQEGFLEKLNALPDRRFIETHWLEQFESLYASAEQVFYSSTPDFDLYRYPMYFKMDDGWTVLYASPDHIGEFDDGRPFEKYPPKYEEMIELVGQEIGNSDDSTVEMLGFYKRGSSAEIAYTPIPIQFKGPAFYRVKAGDTYLNFQEIAIRNIGSGVSSNLTEYMLPNPFREGIDVRFLEFDPHTNITTAGSDGLYVIRKITRN